MTWFLIYDPFKNSTSSERNINYWYTNSISVLDTCFILEEDQEALRQHQWMVHSKEISTDNRWLDKKKGIFYWKLFLLLFHVAKLISAMDYLFIGFINLFLLLLLTSLRLLALLTILTLPTILTLLAIY